LNSNLIDCCEFVLALQNGMKKDIKMKPEYDFSGGIRGKYAKGFAKGSNLIVLAPDVVKDFPDSNTVN
jgi:hypothetical protein